MKTHNRTKDLETALTVLGNRIDELEQQRDELREAFKQVSFAGKYCTSEDDCIANGIDFASYERGINDTINSVHRIFSESVRAMEDK